MAASIVTALVTDVSAGTVCARAVVPPVPALNVKSSLVKIPTLKALNPLLVKMYTDLDLEVGPLDLLVQAERSFPRSHCREE